MGDPLFLVQKFTIAPSLTPGPALLHPPEGLCPHRLQGQAQQVSQTTQDRKQEPSGKTPVKCTAMKGRWESYINVWFLFMYSQKWNCYFQHRIIMFCLLVLHSYICERFIYFQDRYANSAAGKYVDWSWEYINRSQIHECGNWDWGRAIPSKGIHIWDFSCSVDRSGEQLICWY